MAVYMEAASTHHQWSVLSDTFASHLAGFLTVLTPESAAQSRVIEMLVEVAGRQAMLGRPEAMIYRTEAQHSRLCETRPWPLSIISFAELASGLTDATMPLQS